MASDGGRTPSKGTQAKGHPSYSLHREYMLLDLRTHFLSSSAPACSHAFFDVIGMDDQRGESTDMRGSTISRLKRQRTCKGPIEEPGQCHAHVWPDIPGGGTALWPIQRDSQSAEDPTRQPCGMEPQVLSTVLTHGDVNPAMGQYMTRHNHPVDLFSMLKGESCEKVPCSKQCPLVG